MAAYNPAAAKSTFQAAGFTYKGSKLLDPKGDPVKFDVHVIGGWSDWVASLQIVTRNLQAVGIDANVKLEPDWGAWQPNAMSTKFTTLLWNYGGGDLTPYAYFYSHYDPSTNLGPGVDASRDRQLGALLERGRSGAPEAVQGDARSRQAEGDRVQAAVALPRRAAVRAVVHRPALVDVQHEVLRRVGSRGRTSTSTRSSTRSSRSARSCCRCKPGGGDLEPQASQHPRRGRRAGVKPARRDRRGVRGCGPSCVE